MLDNTLEFLYMNGMELPLAVMITIPEPWKHDRYMDSSKKDFYHYYATMMEPWDGPAAILFSDGDIMGAVLDRNGLRPSRYYITDDRHLILSSEVGVLDIPSEHIVEKSRLQPGRILLVDTKQKRVISDEECKNYYASRQPYGEWLDLNLLYLKDIPTPNKKVPTYDQHRRDQLYKVFGYTYEDIKNVLLPMAQNASERSHLWERTFLLPYFQEHPPLSHYFKQLFAQVTNPPIDLFEKKSLPIPLFISDRTVTYWKNPVKTVQFWRYKILS